MLLNHPILRPIGASLLFPALAMAQQAPPLGLPSANFASTSTLVVGAAVGAVADIVSGDFDGDGNTDYVAISSAPSSIVVTLATPGGPLPMTIKQTLTLGTANAAISVVASDFDGDGDTDIAVYRNGLGGTVSIVRIYLNDGTGIFAGSTAISLGSVPLAGQNALAHADLNGDGTQDLVAVIPGGYRPIYVAWGATPTLIAGVPMPTAVQPRGVVCTDMNADGAPDIACLVTNGVGGGVEFFRNNNNGMQPSFSAAADNGFTSTMFTQSVLGISAGDFDNDGQGDVAVVTPTELFAFQDPLMTWSYFTYGTLPSFSGISGDRATEAIDFDGDGLVDLAIADGTGSFAAMRSKGTGFWDMQGSHPCGAAAFASDRDFDGDGIVDVAGLKVNGDIDLAANLTPISAWSVEIPASSCAFFYQQKLEMSPLAMGSTVTATLTNATPNLPGNPTSGATLITALPNPGVTGTTPWPNAGCQLFLDQASFPTATFAYIATDAAGNGSVVGAGPAVNPALIGTILVSQAFMFNDVFPTGTTLAGYDASNALQHTIGW